MSSLYHISAIFQLLSWLQFARSKLSELASKLIEFGRQRVSCDHDMLKEKKNLSGKLHLGDPVTEKFINYHKKSPPS